ncbi:MAG TPA: glutathione S-transferase family protein [Solirubrobacterales bacterium]|nr:glutathione S-transferase family protein [Solirubrobacterales bacterium]
MSTVLWHIPVSHYSEKARWALELKGVRHERRASPPPAHIAVALWLTRGAHHTFPVLDIDGRRIGDTTAIIAALEERFPDPPLHPDDPAERERALALEEFFDEELGPDARLLGFHELRREGDGLREVAATLLPGALARNDLALSVAARAAGSYVQLRYRVDSEEAAARSRAKVLAAFDRLEEELDAGAGDYLVGDRFTVADLTAAALFVPIVGPPSGPALPPAPPTFAAFRDSIRERRGFGWVEAIFERHRGEPIRP